MWVGEVQKRTITRSCSNQNLIDLGGGSSVAVAPVLAVNLN